jgi:hypothetical protein
MFLFDVCEQRSIAEVSLSAWAFEISGFDGDEILVEGGLLHDKSLQTIIY